MEKIVAPLFNGRFSLFKESNISPTQFSKSFHKTLKKWKAKSERGGRMFVKFPINFIFYK